MAQLTAVGDVIIAIVAQLALVVTYPVFDGPFTKRPTNVTTNYVVIGAANPYNDEDVNPINSGSMTQTWTGLGLKARTETITIPCVGVGIAVKGTVATARAGALSVVSDVFANLNTHPTAQTYNALVQDITSIDSRNMAGGAEVAVHFNITADSRLI